MRIASIVPNSIVDGPGIRFTVFIQGCSHHCPGCHNPSTHDPSGGYEESIEKIVDQLRSDPLIDGITLSGGDPFEQPVECTKLIWRVKALNPKYTVWTYTGYTYEQIKSAKNYLWDLLFQNSDVVVDGPFIESLKSYDLKFRGSSNQRLIDTKKTLSSDSIVLWDSEYSILDKFQVPES